MAEAEKEPHSDVGFVRLVQQIKVRILGMVKVCCALLCEPTGDVLPPAKEER